MFKPWAYYVYATTGAVFTGIYPFQTVREYQLERTVIIRKEDETPGVGRKSNITLAVRRDISDHHRVREFQLPFHVEAADTKGKVPVSIIGTIKARVVNPHRAAYGTDRWDIQLINLVTDTLQRFAKRTELDDVLTASSKRAAGAINKVLTTIKDDQIKYGIEIVGFDITDISPVLSDEDLSKLQAEELAKQLGKATRIDGQARADALRAVNDANKVGGTDAVATMQAEALVRAASAVKSGNVILNAGTNSGMADSTSTAILTELQKLNKNLEKGTP
jgi:regulator of protease activity HflC (stomatin/prohibitin superfamily)